MGKAPRKPDPRKQLERSYDRLYALYESGEISPEDTDKLYDLDAQLRPGWEAQAARDEAQSQPMMYDPEVGVPDLGILPVADPLYQKARRLAEDYLPYQISNNLFGRPASQDFLDREGLLGITGVNLATRLIDAPRNSALGNPSQAGADLAMGTLGLLGLVPGGRAAKEVAEGGVNAVRRAVAEPPQRVRDFLADESGAMPGMGAGLPTPRSDAEAIARDILQLRAEGRAEDVTEEMMAAADPQYMYFNTPLPMDAASREARMRANYRGDLYSGTGDDFPAFDNRAVYASTNPDLAYTYAPSDGGMILPLAMRAKHGAPVVDAGGANWNKLNPTMRVGGDNALPIPDDIAPRDIKSFNEWPMATRDYEDAARRAGFSGVTFDNIVDVGGYFSKARPKIGTPEYEAHMDYLHSATKPTTVEARLYPNQVRSRFARFDPEFMHLRNLNASLAAAGVPLGLLAMSPEEEQY